MYYNVCHKDCVKEPTKVKGKQNIENKIFNRKVYIYVQAEPSDLETL